MSENIVSVNFSTSGCPLANKNKARAMDNSLSLDVQNSTLPPSSNHYTLTPPTSLLNCTASGCDTTTTGHLNGPSFLTHLPIPGCHSNVDNQINDDDRSSLATKRQKLNHDSVYYKNYTGTYQKWAKKMGNLK